MARPLRIHVPGVGYHLFARGNDKQGIFQVDADYRRFLHLLARSLERFAIHLLAYCLLWNHYHLLVVPGTHSVSRLMQQVNGAYCQWFNRKYGRVGHLLQGRFGSRLVDDDSYMLTVLRYIVRNPVAAGLVTDPAKWRGSSYAATAGLKPAPAYLSLDRVWRAFDTTDPIVGRQRYTTFVMAGTDDELLTDPLLLGGEALAGKVAPLLEPHKEEREFIFAERYATRPPLAELLAGAYTRQAREEAARVAFCRHAYTLREIGDAMGRAPCTIWTWVKRAEGRLR